MPRLLELFSKTKSVSKVAKALGWETISLDIDPKFDPCLCMDILQFDYTQFPKNHFSFVWASPDCRAYSVARSNAKIPREEAMAASDVLVEKTRQIINYFSCAYCIENPASSRLWKREVAAGLQCITTSYCVFGYPYRKNTMLANNFGLSLPMCPGRGLCPQMIGSKHMEHAQRGRGGVIDKEHTKDELHSIPEGLIREIFRQLNVGGHRP